MKKFLLLFLIVNYQLSIVNSQAQTLSVTLTPYEYANGYTISCNGAQDGSIDLTVTNATGPYTVLWNDEVTTQDRENLAAGEYTVLVIDSLSDTATASITLLQPSAIDISLYSPSYSGYNIHCNGGSDGEIVANVSGGETPYTYLWSNDSITSSIADLVTGEYTVTVTDSRACFASLALTVTEPPALQSSISAWENSFGFNINCNGAETGSIDLEVSGGALPYDYTWNSGDFTQDVSNAVADFYMVRIEDNNGCVKFDSIVLNEPPALQLEANLYQYPNGTFFTCAACHDGQATLVATGGTGSYNFEWAMFNDENNTAGIDSIYADSLITAVVTDAAGCTDTLVFNLPGEGNGNHPQLIVTKSEYAGGYHVSCNGCANGWINLEAVGGTGPYTFWWEDLAQGEAGANAQNRDSLAAGQYRVRITDSQGLMTNTVITLLQPALFTLNVSSTIYTCNGQNEGKVQADANGGTPPYTYQWQKDGTLLEINNDDFELTETGNYTVLVTDANGNTLSDTALVAARAALTITAQGIEQYPDGAHTACSYNNGTMTIHIQDGNPPYHVSVTLNSKSNNPARVNINNAMSNAYSNMGAELKGFNTSDTLVTIDSLWAGWYEVVVYDLNHCSVANSSTELRNAEVPQLTVTGTEYPNGYYYSCDTCIDAEMTAIVNGGSGEYTYYWLQAPDGAFPVKLTGASGFVQMEDENLNTENEGFPPAVSTQATAANLVPETISAVLVADENGCAAAVMFTLDKPKPLHNVWREKGNVGDSLSFLGTVNDQNLRIVTNDTVRMVVGKNGNIIIKSLEHVSPQDTLNPMGLKLIAADINGGLKTLIGPAHLPTCPNWVWPWIEAQDPQPGENNISLCSYENVGIGWFNPTHRLHVDGDMKINTRLGINTDAVQIGNGPNLKVLATGTDDYAAEFIATGTNGITWQSTNGDNKLFTSPKLGGAGFNWLSQEGDVGLFWSDGAGTDGAGHNGSSGLVIGPQTNGAVGMRIDNFGQVGIGIALPLAKTHILSQNKPGLIVEVTGGNNGLKIQVDDDAANALQVFNGATENIRMNGKGEIQARKFKVTLSDFYDNVFEDSYKLKPLAEVENYINKYGHLPDIPSEKDVLKNGLELGEFNSLLLKKVEELTLYIIDLEKEVEQLKSK